MPVVRSDLLKRSNLYAGNTYSTRKKEEGNIKNDLINSDMNSVNPITLLICMNKHMRTCKFTSERPLCEFSPENASLTLKEFQPIIETVQILSALHLNTHTHTQKNSRHTMDTLNDVK